MSDISLLAGPKINISVGLHPPEVGFLPFPVFGALWYLPAQGSFSVSTLNSVFVFQPLVSGQPFF